MSSLHALRNLSKEASYPVKRKIAPNANHEKQPQFFSTKKRKCVKKSISKPSIKDVYKQRRNFKVCCQTIVKNVSKKMI